MHEDSVFTKIISGDIPAHRIYEDDMTLAFLDTNPLTEGHTLVIPKRQVDKLYDLDDESYQAVMATTKRVMRMLENTLNPVRVGLIVQGFDVPHAHVHVVPINQPDDLRRVPDPQQSPGDAELAKIAERIRQA